MLQSAFICAFILSESNPGSLFPLSVCENTTITLEYSPKQNRSRASERVGLISVLSELARGLIATREPFD